MSRLTVVIDASSLLTPQTGIGRYTSQLVRALSARTDLELSLMCSFRPGPTQPIAQVAASYAPLGVRVKSNPIPNRVLHAAWQLANWPPIEGVAGDCDVFHATNHLAPPGHKARVVATIHDLTSLRFPEWHTAYQRLVAHYLPRSVKRSDLLIADSHSTARDLVELLGVSESKIRVVPLAVAPQFFEPASPVERRDVRERYGLLEGYFLYVGTLEPRKNVGTLLLAHQRLSPALQKAYPLVLAGARGWEDERLFTTIDALEHVRYLGRVPDEDLTALMAEATAFVYPSRYEGFGLPVLEAMAAGAPVVTSNVSSLPEVAGDAAVLLAPEDVTGLARAMEELAADESLRDDLRARGHAQAERFSWEATAAQTVAAYREALG